MKIAIFSDTYLPDINGVSVHIHNIIGEFLKAGHEILLCSPKFSKADFPSNAYGSSKFHHVVLDSVPFLDSQRLTTPYSNYVYKKLKAFEPDIIHVHVTLSIGFNGLIFSKLLNIPIIGTFHTYFMEEEYLKRIFHKTLVKVGKHVLNNLGWSLAHMFYDQCDYIVTPSKYTKDDLVAHGFKKHVHVISNGINKCTSKPNWSLTKEIFKSSNVPNYFLYVGRVSVEKSLDILIHAFAKVQSIKNDTHLVIIGGGLIIDELKDLVENLNLQNFVHFTNSIDHEKLITSDIYHYASAFVSASKSEIQPVSMLEAMSFNLPIIGIEMRGVQELIDNCGLLSKPDNYEGIAKNMLTILNPKTREEYVKLTQQTLQTHSLENTRNKLIELYKEAIINKRESYLL